MIRKLFFLLDFAYQSHLTNLEIDSDNNFTFNKSINNSNSVSINSLNFHIFIRRKEELPKQLSN